MAVKTERNALPDTDKQMALVAHVLSFNLSKRYGALFLSCSSSDASTLNNVTQQSTGAESRSPGLQYLTQ